ncbi:MAG: phenylalanine--tRNA ligase subunit alpha [Chloroflexota bacterium]|nr:phenylalanine--tRNA ligase subunit alpha [Chloroflexota bacterium]|tara:strand:+ start:9363 stop:10415 length:1053 start_codon:yes stop_codon:yes gene_type:complete
MTSLKEQLVSLERHAISDLEKIKTEQELDEWRINYQGRRNGQLPKLLEELPKLPIEDRKEVGIAANELRGKLETGYKERLQEIRTAELQDKLLEESIDVSLPGRKHAIGKLHPTTQTIREISSIFVNLGYQIVDGPEVESDYYNFEALNIPPDHPARDQWDTLWLDYNNADGIRPLLLRTHTSPMQIRTMEQQEPPIRVIVPGRCYRHEATDATHESMFFQIEGLTVDKGITFADLKGTLYTFARKLFGEERKIRFRCDFFPFVEPGVDMSIDCFSCDGTGCRVCSNSGWIEIMGAGMVHPNVLERVGYDPEIYTGFAFGMGPERISMLKHGIDDIRHFYNNDLRFLEQF